MSQALAVRYDPRLIEETVFHARRQRHDLKGFDAQRNRIYEVPDADERETRFNELHYSWFARLGLDKTIEAALQEQPLIASEVGNCFIVCAGQSKEEGAELFVAPTPRFEEGVRRTVRVALRPESLLDRERLLTFLRHELFHIADMLDPEFAYEPVLPNADGGPTHDHLITNRYRVLWDVTIDGRMTCRGWLPDSTRVEQLADFCGAFPMLGENAEGCFDRFFGAGQPRHSELAAFSLAPRTAGGDATGKPTPGAHCPLCKFPTHSYEPQPERLDDEVLAAIARDFPHWTAELGLCAQCADLYRANRLSLEAAKLLPGCTPSPTLERSHVGHEDVSAAAPGK